MVTSVWPDGKVGFIQPIGADPKAVTKEMTEVYGVGGFPDGGTEITRLIDKGILIRRGTRCHGVMALMQRNSSAHMQPATLDN